MSNRFYLEKKGIGYEYFFFLIYRTYENEVGGNPKTR